jgi:hypothetical protein
MMPWLRNTSLINIKKYISMELIPNAIICAFYTNGVGGVAEQFRLQNPTVRVRPKKGLL